VRLGNRISQVPRTPPPQYNYLAFQGGLDETVPPWEADPGSLRESQNFEMGLDGGYRDIQGYERYDGRPSPSAQNYALLNVTITGTFTVGDTITGVTSTETAVVISTGTSGAQAYLVITKDTGAFNVSEDLQVSGVTEGNTDDTQVPNGGSTPFLQATYKSLTANEYRSDIGAIPGAGSVLGIGFLSSVVYGFRNNVGNTEADLYKATAAGWVKVPLGRELPFTGGGSYIVAEGDTITGAISGATAVITRISLESGSWEGDDGSGRLIFASQTGTFQSENLDVGANLNVATIAADSTAITLLPGGDYETVRANLLGSSRIYGCDKLNRGFEFDGTVFAPIATGMVDDTPDHVVVHNNSLFFSFDNSIQHSGTGKPFNWEPILGAAEIATEDLITGFAIQPGESGDSALLILNANLAHVLYGNSVLDWNLVEFRDEVGAYENSIQTLGETFFMGQWGVTSLKTTQKFGNFVTSTVSDKVRETINIKKTEISSSLISRAKSQYRVYFNDKSGYHITIANGKLVGIMPIVLSHSIETSISVEKADGSEGMYFGSDAGIVYELDKGTSFDGIKIEASLVFHYHNMGTPRFKKRWMSCALEVSGSGYGEFFFAYDLGYGDVRKMPQPSSTAYPVQTEFLESRWDEVVWDAFTWDGVTLEPSRLGLSGSAENMGIIIRKNSDIMNPLAYSGAFIRYLNRRYLR
jgi:hypothetical protein